VPRAYDPRGLIGQEKPHAQPHDDGHGSPGIEPGISPPEEGRVCLVCAEAAEDLICIACRQRIQGEALERKWEEERRGRG